ncbi:AAA domain-containing protein [Phycomyces nitens]|nr:AAA domain-containing protein [Phycomyces nitens]
MLGSGIKVDQLGVISVYRSQLRAAAQCFEYIKHLEISTIDRYQGRDKDCIIISLVRNNPQKQTGDLLKDWKRINVAMTRAKKKMILIGSESTLDTFILFKRLLAMLRANNWIYKLPQNADISHSIPQNDQINKTEKSKIHITPNSLRSKAILADYVPETS